MSDGLIDRIEFAVVFANNVWLPLPIDCFIELRSLTLGLLSESENLFKYVSES